MVCHTMLSHRPTDKNIGKRNRCEVQQTLKFSVIALFETNEIANNIQNNEYKPAPNNSSEQTYNHRMI